jgi:hypothetical protein
MNRRSPSLMTFRRAGDAVLSPTGISTAPFWLENLVEGGGDGDLAAIRADIAPGIITKWHSHPQGQLIYVLSGVGMAQAHGGQVQELRAGEALARCGPSRRLQLPVRAALAGRTQCRLVRRCG